MDRSDTAKRVRRIILERSKSANAGHIGSALSIVEILVSLYWDVLKHSEPRAADRDRVILSKGHAALALYAVLYLKGWLSETDLHSFCSDDTLLGVHPEHTLAGVDFSTGSLGMGLSFAAGAALAARLQGSHRQVYVVMSDAECNEGAIWEAAMFAAHHKLDNLVALVDVNGQQALGYTEDVMRLEPLDDRWRSFGWNVHRVDGHDIGALTSTINHRHANEAPRVVIADTTFGKGVSYMHNQIQWHYAVMNDDQYTLAVRELETIG
jgi:transketolase